MEGFNNTSGSKNKRGSNFTRQEISSLMTFIFQNINVIENKKTDNITVKEKQEVWKTVLFLFNSSHTSNRDLNSIKIKYENIKRQLKKKMSLSRLNRLKTGGGPPEDLSLLWYEEKLYGVLQLNVDGMESMGDSDSFLNINEIQEENDNVIIEQTLIDHDYPFIQLENDAFNSEIQNEITGITEVSEQIQTPIITPSTSKAATTNKKWNLKRKRVTIRAEDKKENIENFQKLAKTKTDLAEVQKKCYEVELNLKEEELHQKRHEWKIQNQILDVDLKTKIEQYEEILRENIRKEKLSDSLEEEQKIKIEILKCDLNFKLKQSLGISRNKI